MVQKQSLFHFLATWVHTQCCIISVSYLFSANPQYIHRPSEQLRPVGQNRRGSDKFRKEPKLNMSGET
jgi:hypothetical protein